MKTPFPNAFTIHRLGLAFSTPFPLSVVTASPTPGAMLFDLFPQSLTDMADLIESHAQDTLLVFDVEHSTMERLEVVARQGHLPHVSYRPNAIAVARGSLRRLLNDLGHWDFHLLDHPGPPTNEAVEQSPLNHRGNEIVDIDLVPSKFPKAKIVLHSHDDCYLRIYSAQETLPRRIFARTLEIWAGTILGKENPASQDVGGLPAPLVDRLWSIPSALTFPPKEGRADGEVVVMGFSRTECSLIDKREYPLAGRLTYRLADRTWSLEGREAR